MPALTRDRLAHVNANYLRLDTIRAANAALIDAQAGIGSAQMWGGGHVASVDGTRFVVPVNTLHAGPNPRYFNRKKGATWLKDGQRPGRRARRERRTMKAQGNLQEGRHALGRDLFHRTAPALLRRHGRPALCPRPRVERGRAVQQVHDVEDEDEDEDENSGRRHCAGRPHRQTCCDAVAAGFDGGNCRGGGLGALAASPPSTWTRAAAGPPPRCTSPTTRCPGPVATCCRWTASPSPAPAAPDPPAGAGPPA